MHEGIDDFHLPDEESVASAVETLRMLADPTRLKIMWALVQGEENVACLADIAGARPTAISQHLAKLRLAGLVHTRREGTYIYYTAVPGVAKRILEAALEEREPAEGA
ncbi:ArsR/SmtB family transcription factor [Salininema proteolyticum]|uniref:ArsR/SmtB family transcription factor n=1 Tax=Salininema proteolyticum TaxID=1607685 RepID=A0ABV8TWA6_9ACTN